jgi:hypothetical protein
MRYTRGMKSLACLLLLACAGLPAAQGGVLIVADEIPAMEVLAKRLAPAAATIVQQPDLPADLRPFDAVVVYVHRNLDPAVEKASIDYANAGGRLVLLHHTISSGKRKNRDWFPFLGVTLAEGDVSQGGYKWIEGVDWEMVNLAPGSEITTGGVAWPASVEYKGSARPGVTVAHSEVYLNHHLTGPRTVLLGLKFRDPKTGVLYEQDTAGWYRRAGKGWVMYFMAGHSVEEFHNPVYARILANALTARLR